MLKNITLSAEESEISKARKKAQHESTTLNAKFRLWLTRYANADIYAANYKSVMDSLSYANPGRSFTRDEMNER